jgi:hypothetical protein
METGAIVALTRHGGAAADSATVAETLCEAGEAVAELMDVKNAEGKYPVAGDDIAGVVADKGYPSNQTTIGIKELGQAAACNLALLPRSLHGAGKPRAAHDLKSATLSLFRGSRPPYSGWAALIWLVHRYRARTPAIARSMVREPAVP